MECEQAIFLFLNQLSTLFLSIVFSFFLFSQSNKKRNALLQKLEKIGEFQPKIIHKCWSDLTWALTPKNKQQIWGEKKKRNNAHKNAALIVCVPGITSFSLFAFTLSCPTYHSSLVLYSFFFFKDLLSQRKKKKKRPQKKRKKCFSFFLSSSLIGQQWKQQIGLREVFVH